MGATVMTIVAFRVERFHGSMPAHASFLPGFWLLVPGFGSVAPRPLSGLAAGGSTHDLVATIGSIFARRVGVLCGTQLLAWLAVTGRVIDKVSGTVVERSPWLRRLSGHADERVNSTDDD